jgi:hypothetical protein
MAPGTRPARASAPAPGTPAHGTMRDGLPTMAADGSAGWGAHRSLRRWLHTVFPVVGVLAVVVLAAGVLTACGGSPAPKEPGKSETSVAPAAPAVGVNATAPDGRGAIRPLPALSGCTRTATDPISTKEVLSKPVPGDKICITGDLGNFRTKVLYSGTDQAPIQVVGDGQTRVRGIEVDANNVVVDGFTVLNAKSPEVQLFGNSITLQNTVIRNATSSGFDNLYFFGNNIKILHNTLGDTGGDPTDLPNCIETFSTDIGSSPSHNVLIDSNRCENSPDACLSASGPHAPQGTKQGDTSDIRFTNNYCQARGEAAVLLNDIQKATISGNVIDGPNHAWSLQNNSTGATIASNTIGAGTQYEVGMDHTSKAGYQGPAVGGAP